MASGEMAFLTGHSGAGKSTLLRLLLLLDRASSGEVSVNGRPLSKIRESGIAAYRRDFGVVFQDHKLLFDHQVLVNAEDDAIRLNRLALLKELRGQFLRVADLAVLAR